METACVAFSIRGALWLWFAVQGEFPLAECSCQKLVWGRRCNGASALCGRAGLGCMAGAWAQNAFARPILHPHEGEPVGSGFRAPRTPNKAAGPREPGQSSPGCPMESGGPGMKTACVAFSIRGALWLWFAAQGEFPLAERSCQKLVWGRWCHRASALSGRAGPGGMAGAWAQKAFARPIPLPHEREPMGSGFREQQPPSKAAGPRELGQPSSGSP